MAVARALEDEDEGNLGVDRTNAAPTGLLRCFFLLTGSWLSQYSGYWTKIHPPLFLRTLILDIGQVVERFERVEFDLFALQAYKSAFR